MFVIANMPHLIKKLVNSLVMSSLQKSKINMEFDGYPLNSKIIQDVCRKRNKGYHRR